MAKAKNSDRAGGGQASARGFLLALIMLTLLGGGAGVLFGMQVGGVSIFGDSADAGTSGAEAKAEAKSASKGAGGAKSASAAKTQGGSGDAAGGTNLVPLEPIFANLAEPNDVWMRLEAALIVKAGTEQRDVLIAKVSQDLMQFLRTVKLAQLEDASGLQFLRDDLNDIVRSRSDGQVTELLVKGLIVE